MAPQARRWTCQAIWMVIGWMVVGAAAQAASVPLTFSAAPTARWSIATGVPFPRGAVTSLAQLRVDDASGREAPAQFESLARWPDGSQKSVLVIVIADPGAPGPYTLHYGPGVSRAAPTTSLSFTDEPAALTVTTGPIRFRLDKTRLSVFDQVWVDANHDGAYDASEQALAQPGDLFAINAFDGLEYASSRFLAPTYAIEESGPLRIVVRIAGQFQAAGGQQLAQCIIRITAVAGLDAVGVEATLVDPRTERDVNASRAQLALSLASYGLRLSPAFANPLFTVGGEQDARYSGPVTGDHALYQDGAMNYVDGFLNPFSFAYDGVGTGSKAPGWMDVSDGHAGIGVCVRNFWQQFPKELAIRNQQLVVGLHPARASQPSPDLAYPAQDPLTKRYQRPNTLYFPREGGAKTYQLLVCFHAPEATAANRVSALNALFQDPPRLMAPAAWYARSGVFGELIEAGPWSEGYDRYLIDGIYDRSVAQQEATGGLSVQYGWRDFGDRMRPGWAYEDATGTKIPSFYNDTHVGAHIFFIQYLRTLDARWWHMGERASRHWMDIDVSHCNRFGYWKQDGAAVGFGPGEIHAIKHEVVDHDDRNLHWGHAHLSGLPDYYLLTGDRRALEVMNEVGTWWTNAAPVFFPTQVVPHFAEAERDYGWPLFVMNEAYRATGDMKYLQAGAQVVRHLIGWWQTPSDHWVNGSIIGRNDFAQGTGWWYMNPRCDNCPDGYNGTNPWMAGALIGSAIEFLRYDQDFHYVDDAALQEMLLQTMNYVVKHGWETSRRWRSYDYFVYSEGAREIDGGWNHLMFPLAYLWRRLKAGGVAHPEWYDTAPTWYAIAKSAYDDWQQVYWRGTTALGFYGYEMILPADFFAIMRGLEAAPSDNHAPVLMPIADPTLQEGVPWQLTINATDPDAGDTLTYTVAPLPAGSTFNAASHTLSWTPSFDQAGVYTLTVSVTDAAGAAASQALTLTVQPVNRPPAIEAIADQTVTVGATLRVTAHATDPDGDPLRFAANAGGPLPAGASLDAATGVFSWAPALDQAGRYSVAIVVSDGQLEALASFTITVADAPVNHAPVFDTLTNPVVREGALLTMTIQASDPDGDAVTVSVSSLPPGAAFDPVAKLLTWTPTATQAGSYVVGLKASDGQATSAASMTITVQEAILALGGRVTLWNGDALPNTRVELIDNRIGKVVVVTLTDARGGYQFSGLAKVTYTLRPVLDPSVTGARFDPASQKISLSTTDRLSVNFSQMLTSKKRMSTTAQQSVSPLQPVP